MTESLLELAKNELWGELEIFLNSYEKAVDVDARLRARESLLNIDKNANSLLHWAAFHGYHPIIVRLITAGLPTSEYNLNGLAPIHLAVKFGHIQCTQEFQRIDPTLLLYPDDAGRSPFMIATINSNLAMMEWLYLQGISIHQADREGNTIAHYSVSTLNKTLSTHALQYVLRRGADISRLNKHGMSLFESKLYESVLAYCLVAGYERSPFLVNILNKVATERRHGITDPLKDKRRSQKGSIDWMNLFLQMKEFQESNHSLDKFLQTSLNFSFHQLGSLFLYRREGTSIVYSHSKVLCNALSYFLVTFFKLQIFLPLLCTSNSAPSLNNAALLSSSQPAIDTAIMTISPISGKRKLYYLFVEIPYRFFFHTRWISFITLLWKLLLLQFYFIFFEGGVKEKEEGHIPLERSNLKGYHWARVKQQFSIIFSPERWTNIDMEKLFSNSLFSLELSYLTPSIDRRQNHIEECVRSRQRERVSYFSSVSRFFFTWILSPEKYIRFIFSDSLLSLWLFILLPFLLLLIIGDIVSTLIHYQVFFTYAALFQWGSLFILAPLVLFLAYKVQYTPSMVPSVLYHDTVCRCHFTTAHAPPSRSLSITACQRLPLFFQEKWPIPPHSLFMNCGEMSPWCERSFAPCAEAFFEEFRTQKALREYLLLEKQEKDTNSYKMKESLAERSTARLVSQLEQLQHQQSQIASARQLCIPKEWRESILYPEKSSMVQISKHFCLTCELPISLSAYEDNESTLLPEAEECVKHCSICGCCQKQFDHHCDWMSNCVGNGNRKIFIVFLTLSAVALAIFILMVAFRFSDLFYLHTATNKAIALKKLLKKREGEVLGHWARDWRDVGETSILLRPLWELMSEYYSIRWHFIILTGGFGLSSAHFVFVLGVLFATIRGFLGGRTQYFTRDRLRRLVGMNREKIEKKEIESMETSSKALPLGSEGLRRRNPKENKVVKQQDDEKKQISKERKFHVSYWEGVMHFFFSSAREKGDEWAEKMRNRAESISKYSYKASM